VDDAALRGRLREISRERPQWGYRSGVASANASDGRAHATLLQEGGSVNRKRVQRLWREEGLLVPEVPPSAFALSAPTMCGGLTSSSTRPPMGRP
jgi:transposase InsO family protein